VKRRHFMALTALGVSSAGSIVAFAADAKKAGKAVTEKDILKEGMPASIANFCDYPDKKPNKICPDVKGICKDCLFYNKDGSETDFKGEKVARCQLLADPTKPQFVHARASCATFVKKA
jgi:hypothetical protein